MKVKRSIKLLHLLFWSVCIILWCFWVNERIEIFSWFVDDYKNIGYYIDTNDYQLSWYILISLLKASFSLVIIYHILPKFKFSKSAFLSILIALGVFMGVEYALAKGFYVYLSSLGAPTLKLNWNYSFLHTFLLFIIVGFSSVILVAANSWIKEYQNLKSLYSTQQAYTQLRKKLNPHFIFNTLNNMYEVAIVSGDERIQNSLLHLTDTLRYTLQASDKERTLLTDEIKTIESYIELQKERFEKNEIDIEITIKTESRQLTISPLVLLNYIENAFEHGYKYGQKSKISIAIIEQQGLLDLTISNTNWANRTNKSGGNSKTKKLLDLVYPNQHKLIIDSTNELYNLHLWIQLV